MLLELGNNEQNKRSKNFKKIVRLEVFSKDDFKTDIVRSLYEWWSSFRPSLPQRSDFDISKHWRLAAHLYIIEVVGPGKYLVRLNGEKAVEIIGATMRGREISAESSAPERQLFAKYLDSLIESKQCRRCSGTADVFDKNFLEFETVDCPLVDEKGDVAYFIGAISLTGQTHSE